MTIKNAFSLVELLITLVLIAVMGSIAIGVYNNLSKSAQLVAQNKDQQDLQQIVETFHTSGGDVSSVASLRDPHQQAATLTAMFQSPSSSIQHPRQIWVAYHGNHAYVWKAIGQSPGDNTGLTSGTGLTNATEKPYRTQKGTIFGGLPSNKMIIPYLATGISASLYPTGSNVSVFYFDPATKQLKLGVHPTGYTEFIVVDKNSALGQAETAYLNSATGNSASIGAKYWAPVAVNKISLTGAKYAAANPYIWDEDKRSVSGPGTSPVVANPPVALLLDVELTGGLSGTPTAFNYNGYITGTATIFVYRADGLPLSDGTTVSAYLGNSSNTFNGVAGTLQETINGNTQSVTGLKIAQPLNTMLPATSWSASSYPLTITVTPGYNDIAPSANSPIVSIGGAIPLAGQITSPGVIAHGGTFTFDGTTDGATINPAGVAAINLNPPNVGGLNVSQSFNASYTQDVCTYN